jgi:hypothetical protein
MKNEKVFLWILLSVLCLYSAGCATVMTGKYQSIPVTSEPQGIKVRADTGEMIITPGKFHLIRNEEHTLVAECPGYEPQQLKLHNKAQGWVWGNILLGGVVGLIVDCSSGASDELIPKEVHFNFGNPQMTTREATKIEEKDKKPLREEPQFIGVCAQCGRHIGKDEIICMSGSKLFCPECFRKISKNR